MLRRLAPLVLPGDGAGQSPEIFFDQLFLLGARQAPLGEIVQIRPRDRGQDLLLAMPAIQQKQIRGLLALGEKLDGRW